MGNHEFSYENKVAQWTTLFNLSFKKDPYKKFYLADLFKENQNLTPSPVFLAP